MKPGLAIALTAAVLLGLGCGQGGFSKRTQSESGGVFRYPIVTNPTTLDPHRVQDGDSIDLVQQVFEGLTMWGTDNTPQPNLAERWEISDDGKTYTFFLKQGVKFHDGTDFSADDVKWAIERACDPKLGSTTAPSYLDDIVGAMEMIEGKAESVSGIEVVDPSTVKITLVEPRPYFLGKMTYPVAYMVSKKAAQKGTEINSKEAMVGTGPFKLESYQAEQKIVLSANKEYHSGSPKIERIERQVIKDAPTRLNKFKNGEVDLVPLERQDIAALEADPEYKDKLKFYNRPSLWYVGMNAGVKPFNDRRVRRAVAMAIDKEKIVNDLLGGANQIANSILPPGVLGHREKAASLPYDPAEAKRELAAAGYPNGANIPPLTIYYREARPDIRIVSEAVASMLKQNLGINVSLRALEWGNYLEQHNQKKLPFVHMRWGADYLDPQNFLSLLLASYGSENKMNYSNPEYDALCRRADSTLDEQERLLLYAKAEDIVLQDAPFVPIYFQRDAELISPRVSGLQESLFGHLPHKTVEVK